MNPDIEDDNPEQEWRNLEDASADEHSSQQLIRKGKQIVFVRPPSPVLDESVVSVQRYNCFGTNLFPSKNADMQVATGVTSAGTGDGKTVVAANLATFFALDTQDETVLIDLNFTNPRMHEVFGVSATPGILESLSGSNITLTRTSIKGLWVLPLGDMKGMRMSFDRVLELREIIALLKERFRFIVIDLPSANEQSFPAMITSQLDGYVVVVSAGKTKKTDITNLVTLLNENKIIGFVMNRVSQGMVKT